MGLKTSRTSLYYYDTNTDDIITIGCVTGISPGGAAREQLDVTCLEDDARSFIPGMAVPGEKTFTINFDPEDDSHVLLYNLYEAGTTVQWALGFPDGNPAPAVLTAPTTASDGGFVLPDTRSWLTYEGYVTNVPLDFPLGGLLNANVSVQISGFPQLHPRTET